MCGPTGGPATYGRRLVESLAALVDADLELTVITDRPEAFAGHVPEASILGLPMSGGIDRVRWQHWALPRALGRIRPDLYHDTKNAIPRRCPVPAVVTVHDLAYYRCPETFGLASRTFLRRSTTTAVRRARRILVPSAATQRDIAAIYPGADARTRVVLHGITPHLETTLEERAGVLQHFDVTTRFVLHVGTIQARKNVDLLVRAVRQLRREGHDLRVVLAGRRGWLSAAANREMDADDTARWLGVVSDLERRALYDAAIAFVSPSAYEGFGFTVADALAAGVPTVISAISSLPEVCGDAAIPLEEVSAEAIVGELRRILGDDGLAHDLAEAGRRRAAEFSWSRCAEQTLAVYREAAGSGS